jgi:uncharacterized phage protein gp47/JayE
MPFARPTLTQLRNYAVEDITTSGVPGLTGLLRNAVLRVLSWAMAGLAYSVYGYADWIARMGVPFTSEDEYLYAWAALVGIYPEPATPASGEAQFTGTEGVPLPSGSSLNTLDGTPFETTGDGTIDATGSVTVPIIASVSGAATNLPPATPIFITGVVPGINSNGQTVGYATGGADPETQDALRTRMLLRYRAPPAGGDATDYVQWALQVPGCTRAWCQPLAMGAGSVTVFPMFDISRASNAGFPIGTDGTSSLDPRPSTGTATGDQGLVADYIYPLQPVTALVYVVAPQPQSIDITLAALNPGTSEIKDAIAASVADMLLYEGVPGGIIYPSQIYDAALATPGIVHFVMLEPSEAVQLAGGHLPVVGVVTATDDQGNPV